eukprot:352606-Chlamydomonas_euryale.AAC.4
MHLVRWGRDGAVLAARGASRHQSPESVDLRKVWRGPGHGPGAPWATGQAAAWQLHLLAVNSIACEVWHMAPPAQCSYFYSN